MIDWLQSHLGRSPQRQTRLLVPVGTIVGLWLVRHFVLGFVYRRVRDPWGRYRWRKVLTYVLVTVGVVTVGGVWFSGGVGELLRFVGILSAGLGIALQGPRPHIARSAFIIWRRPLHVGDRPHIRNPAGGR